MAEREELWVASRTEGATRGINGSATASAPSGTPATGTKLGGTGSSALNWRTTICRRQVQSRPLPMPCRHAAVPPLIGRSSQSDGRVL